MRITRVYFEGSLSSGDCVTLPPDNSHYLINVLRLKKGANVALFNAHDGEFEASITQADKQALQASVGDKIKQAQTSLLEIHLGLGLSRGDRMDYAVQKSTELGVTSITPLYCQFSEAKLKADRIPKKQEHWQRIAISASEQCGRLDPPAITAPAMLEEWQAQLKEGMNCILDPTATDSFDTAAQPSRINLLIGPEGGFSNEERRWASATGFQAISLGPRILRTETAPVAALAILQFLYS